jgi:dTDP-4-amino-4,6-dideoxygalactose transaminase
MEFKINFSGRGHQYTKEEVNIVAKVMQEADPLTQGKYRDEFERDFAEYLNVPYAFSLCNATAALELSAQLCQFNSGDEVIAPVHTFTSSVYPFIKKGATIVWADIDLKTRVVNAENIKKKITSKTKAIIVVHLYGFAVDMTEIMKLAKSKNILVIEDTAQALGAEVDNTKAGTFGDFGIYSLHSHKNITTLGEGGILTVKNAEYARIIPLLRHNGHISYNSEREYYWIPAMGDLDLPELDGKVLWPSNYCLGEVECALGTQLLKRLDLMNSEKRGRAIYMIDQLKEYSDILEFHRVDDIRHNYHLLIGRMLNGKRDEFMKKMAFEKRIKCVVQYYPLYRYPLYKKAGFGECSDCPNSDILFDNMISFPFHHWMSDSDFEYMINSTKEILQELK